MPGHVNAPPSTASREPSCYGAPVRIGSLDCSLLPEVTAILAAGCPFDRAAEVADEKLFGDGPGGPPRALGAWEGDALVGVAAVSGSRIRVLAVAPGARARGLGRALLDACCAAARDAGVTTLRTLDQPGNYLAPGIDERNTAVIGWLERRGWHRHPEPRVNVLIDVRGNPRVSAARAGALAAAAAARGYEVRRAHAGERAADRRGRGRVRGRVAVRARARPGGRPTGRARRDQGWCVLQRSPPTTATTAASAGSVRRARGRRIADRAWARRSSSPASSMSPTHHARCEVAWIGPRAFYDKVAGIAADRRFVVLTRDLA